MRLTTTLISSILMISLWLSFSQTQSNAEIIDKIVAQVGSKIVTLHDVEKFAPVRVRNINAMTDTTEKDAAWKAYYEESIEFMIYDRVLEIAASRVGITATDREITDNIALLQEQNTQFRDHVREILNREGDVTPELYLFVKQLILKNKISSELVRRSVVTDKDIQKYLRENESEYSRYTHPEYNIDIAFLANEEDYELFQRFSGNNSFADAAKAAGASVINMGWLRASDLLPIMQTELMAMQPGGVSDGVKDESGRYIVMKLNDTRDIGNLPENVKNAITYTLMEKQLQTIFNNWLERQKQSIIVNRY